MIHIKKTLPGESFFIAFFAMEQPYFCVAATAAGPGSAQSGPAAGLCHKKNSLPKEAVFIFYFR